MMDLSGMALAAFHAGRLEEARTLSRDAVHTLAKYPKVEDLRRAYFNHFLILREGLDEDVQEATAALRRAKQLVVDRLQSIPEPGLRRTFVRNVPLVKEILAAGVRPQGEP